MALEDEIRAAIESSLPEQVGKTLKQRLEKAEKDAADVIRLNSLLLAASEEKRDLRRALDKHEKLDEREVANAKREVEITVRELRQDLVDARAQAANEKCNAIFELASIVFRNPRLVRTESERSELPSADGCSYRESRRDSTITEETE